MNKKCIGLLLAIPALMGFGLASCSNDEPVFTKEESATKKVEVSLIAELGNTSRASLSFDESKNLKFKWANEDVIYAVNGDNGKYLGKLTVAKVLEDPRNCEFKGTLNLPSLGSANLKFYYLGEKGEMQFDSETYLPKDIEVDYSAQTGTAAELDDYDLLKAEKAYNSTDNGKLGRLSFERHFSTGQFVLKYNGEELSLNGKTVAISAASGTLYNKASLNYKSGEYTHYEGVVSVTPSTNNFYINIIPTESVQFKFTVDMGDGKVFEGVKGGKIVEDTYYSDNLEAIVVEMKKTDGSDDEQTFKLIYNPNYTPTSDGEKVYDKNRIGSAEYRVQTYDLFTREGYDLVGWNTAADGSGDAYEAGQTLTITWPETTVTLYAQWTEKKYEWKIQWKDDPAVGTEVYKTKLEGGTSPHTLASVHPDTPTKEGYNFVGWEYEGKMLPKEPGASEKAVVMTEANLNPVIYAKWEKATYDLKVIAWSNDGTDNKSEKVEYNNTLPHKFYLDNLDIPTRTGYIFVGWGLTKDATETVGTVTFTTPADINVYAIWKKDTSSGNITAPGAGGSDY